MRVRRISALAATLVLSSVMATAVGAQPRDPDRDRGGRDGEWADLGCQTVKFTAERDSVRVGRREGRFKAIRLFARGGDVEILDLKVIYTNGEPDDIQVRRVLRRGDRTRELDLRGWQRSIDRIDMVYRTVPNFRGREAIVCVEGLQGRMAEGGQGPGPGPGPRPGGDGGSWTELGCKEVSLFRTDRDSLRVGRREGRFKAIRLHVRGADVEMLDLKVIYTNGAPDDIQVRHLLRQGERTRPLDLRGWERSIDRVDMVYRTIPNFKGLARVCVEGLQG